VDSVILRDSPRAFYTFNDLENYSGEPISNSTDHYDYEDFEGSGDSMTGRGPPDWLGVLVLFAAVRVACCLTPCLCPSLNNIFPPC